MFGHFANILHEKVKLTLELKLPLLLKTISKGN